MSNKAIVRPCTCDCCYEIWYSDNMKNVRFGNRNLHLMLCPECFAEFDKEFMRKLEEAENENSN